MTWLEQFKAARRAKVPIIIIRSADYPPVMQAIIEALPKETPAVQHDAIQGVLPLNESGKAAAAAINKNEDGNGPALVTGNPNAALERAVPLLPSGTILFMKNLHLFLEGIGEARKYVIQAVLNVRDPFEAGDSNRTLVILCPEIKLPPEMVNDVIMIDVPLPGEAEIQGVVSRIAKASGVAIDEATLPRAVDALTGLSAFAAKQISAMCLRKTGYDLEEMWLRKKAAIEQLAGLSVHRGEMTLDQLGGLTQIKAYLRMIIAARAPKIVVLMDELEKAMAGASGGDNTGVSQDFLGTILSNMEDNRWSGILSLGFPGSGKTALGKAMGDEAGGLFVKMDLGGMKTSALGDSEKAIRAAMKSLKAMGGERVFFIGTINSITAIKPELKSRFKHGIFFFDLPSQEEQAPIWDIYRTKFALDPTQPLPPSEGWTGREIEAICERAAELNVPLTEVAQFISPVVSTMADEINKLRKMAHNKFLSASYPGLYQSPSGGAKPKTIAFGPPPSVGSN